jgi:hypothetical protein
MIKTMITMKISPCGSAVPGANRGREAAPTGNRGVPSRI